LFLDLFLILDLIVSAFQRLVGRTFDQNELSPLIEVIFSSRSASTVVNSLRGDDVRTFVEVMDKVYSTLFPPQEIRLTGVGIATPRRLGIGRVRPLVKDPEEMHQIVVQGLPFPRAASELIGDPRLL